MGRLRGWWLRTSGWLHDHSTVRMILVAVVVSSPGYWELEHALQNNERTVASIIDARTEARVVSCHDQNDETMKINVLLTAAISRSTPSDRLQTVLDATLFPIRVCTPEAVNKHFNEGH